MLFTNKISREGEGLGKHRRIVRTFRAAFKTAMTSTEKVALLREIAQITYYKAKPNTISNHRRKFEKVKWKVNIVGKCAVCRAQADVRHHLIQIKNGGQNKPFNIMLLCNGCHAEVHPWLKRG